MLFPTVDFAVFFCLVFLGHWLLNPRPAAVEALHDRGELRLLRLVGRRTSCGSSRGSRDRAGRRDSRWRARTGAPATLGDGDRRGRDARAARVLQVLRLLLGQPRRTRSSSARAPRRAPARDPADPAGRRLVLLVHGGGLRRGRLPPTVRSRRAGSTLFLYLSFFPHLVAGPIVRPERADPPARRPPRPAARRRGRRRRG